MNSWVLGSKIRALEMLSKKEDRNVTNLPLKCDQYVKNNINNITDLFGPPVRFCQTPGGYLVLMHLYSCTTFFDHQMETFDRRSYETLNAWPIPVLWVHIHVWKIFTFKSKISRSVYFIKVASLLAFRLRPPPSSYSYSSFILQSTELQKPAIFA